MPFYLRNLKPNGFQVYSKSEAVQMQDMSTQKHRVRGQKGVERRVLAPEGGREEQGAGKQ